MGEKTGIAWATHTWSPWIGCTEISTAKSGGGGCDNCYARELDKRHKFGGATHWGVGVPRYRTKSWHLPIAWNKKAAAAEERARIFPSLCDPFDNEVPREWRYDLWRLIEATPNLSWLLVTKRVGNVAGMIPVNWEKQFPDNVRLLITVCNQEEADRDIPKLLALPCKNGVSYEPALGPVDWSRFQPFCRGGSSVQAARGILSGEIGWIICGGESTQGAGKARPFDLAWARSTVSQCKAAGVPVFVKQLGSRPIRSKWPPDGVTHIKGIGWHNVTRWKDRAGADPAEWPEDLRVQCFPDRGEG